MAKDDDDKAPPELVRAVALFCAVLLVKDSPSAAAETINLADAFAKYIRNGPRKK